MVFALVPLFLGSFLLFIVQPLFVQRILPWFGGGACIWITCTVFFQVLLLVGYAYSSYINSKRYPGKFLHIFILLMALVYCCTTNIFPENFRGFFSGLDPTLNILLLLFSTIALPFFILSTTSVLVQGWVLSNYKKYNKNVYKLFSLSNFASLTALLSYPFLFEPLWGLSYRVNLWEKAFYIYLFAMLIFTLLVIFKSSDDTNVVPSSNESNLPKYSTFVFWIGMSFCSSVFLSAMTYHLTQDLLPIPLLWLLPLAIYLLTFIISFAFFNKYNFKRWKNVAIVAVLFSIVIRYNIDIYITVILSSVVLFSICYVFHAELADTRPIEKYLGRFYLAISLGGALGGIVSGIIIPYTLGLSNFFHSALFFCFFILMMRFCYRENLAKIQKQKENNIHPEPYQTEKAYFIIVAEMLCAFALYKWNCQKMADIHSYHNFYGSLHVYEEKWKGGKTETSVRVLQNGSTLHGYEIVNRQSRHEALGYYSNLGNIFNAAKKQFYPIRLGVIGLGIGSLAAYIDRDEEIRFYEINPLVAEAAQNHFSYLKEAHTRHVKLDVILGDARRSLESEIGKEQSLDVLVLDAFNSDSIPVHLLTKEALKIYKKRLNANGILFIHISHRHINLKPIVFHFAKELNAHAFIFKNKIIEDYSKMSASEWVIMTANLNMIEFLLKQPSIFVLNETKGISMWTDDYHSLRCLWINYSCKN
ncbi:MAG: fused MFS/spermidine synthase [Pseudomonadota bacterium]